MLHRGNVICSIIYFFIMQGFLNNRDNNVILIFYSG